MAEIDKSVVFNSGEAKPGSHRYTPEFEPLPIMPLLEDSVDVINLTSEDLYLNLDCVEEAVLEAAYQHCHRITKRGSKTFYFGSLLLPYHKRRAMWAFYSFCRYTDDLVDNAPTLSAQQLTQKLAQWETEAKAALTGRVRSELHHMLAWSHSVASFQIPSAPPLELLEGCRMDLNKRRYANFDELRLYCYRVASTVGLVASQIIGYDDPVALNYAIDLGIAMQLTNILRDVGEDAQNGRIYIPQDEMQQFGYSEEELLQGVINRPFVELMQFQIARARQFYQKALPGIEHLTPDSRLSIAVAANLYSRILDMIERNGYDVFTRRAYVPTSRKLRELVVIWRQRRAIGTAAKKNKSAKSNEADA